MATGTEPRRCADDG